jgi:hypothetical protein
MRIIIVMLVTCLMTLVLSNDAKAGDFDFRAVPNGQLCLKIAGKFQNMRDFEISSESSEKEPPFSFIVSAIGKYKDDFGDYVGGALVCKFIFVKSSQEFAINALSFNGGENPIELTGDQFNDLKTFKNIASALFDNSDEGISWPTNEQIIRVVELQFAALNIMHGKE